MGLSVPKFLYLKFLGSLDLWVPGSLGPQISVALWVHGSLGLLFPKASGSLGLLVICISGPL